MARSARFRWTPVFGGAAAAYGARALLARALMLKFTRDVKRLNGGDYRPLLAGYHRDAVLRFNQGEHRWSGEHRGREAIERFMQNFTAAGLQGEIREILFSGPPWRMTLAARFDDHARGPSGELLYENRTVLLVRTRWGRIVEHEDFYFDTGPIQSLEDSLRRLGIEAV